MSNLFFVCFPTQIAWSQSELTKQRLLCLKNILISNFYYKILSEEIGFLYKSGNTLNTLTLCYNAWKICLWTSGKI